MSRFSVRQCVVASCLGLSLGLLSIQNGHCQTTTTGWTSEASSAMQAQGCDPAVVQRISQAQDAEIRSQTVMAHTLFDYIKDIKMSAATCLNSLMPHLYFGRSGSSNIWGQIGNAVCNAIDEMVDPTLSTINGGISSFTGSMSNSLYQNLSLGNGAVNLGSVPMGISVSQSGGQLLNTDALVNSLYDNTTNGTFDYTKNAGSFFQTGNLLNVYGNN